MIWTIGHSVRPAGDLIALLTAHGIARVADVRRMPQSRRHPQFGRERLAASLAAAGIDYRHLGDLGGLREPDGSPTNAGLIEGFRGYADYMQTQGFAAGLAALMSLARERPTAVLCAEADPRHCHRSLLSDALVARGVAVLHITGPGPVTPHALSPGACVAGTRVTYPGRQTELGFSRDDR